MSAPTIPPRPARAQAGPTAVKQETPQIPPRPVRNAEASPDRQAYVRSPLNFQPNSSGNGNSRWAPPSTLDGGEEAPPRRPSTLLALPSEVGQEGIEYTSYDQLPQEAHGAADTSKTSEIASEQTRNVSADVPLHQPKASLPQSSAKNRISTVTRTDSTQAAAAGIGKARPDDDVHKMPSDSGASLSRVTSRTYDDHLRRVPSAEPHPLRASASFNRSSSSLQNGTPRPPSIHSTSEHHEGIPEIGQQIPLYKNAGDVQAPSPAPTQSQFASGIGFFNDGSQRAHHRKRSSRQEFLPPGSYGLHGHGAVPQDQFERDWMAKHPEEAMKEGYTPYLRPETALSSDQLNRLVSENNDVGMGTSRDMIGTPSQDIAFEATDQWASRHNSPMPTPAPLTELKKRPSSGHQPPIESPLRKQSFPFNETAQMRSDRALESEDDDVVHVTGPARRGNKITGGGAHDGKADLGPTGGNTDEAGGWITEGGESTPILASDEIVKRPSSAFLQPAVSPEETRTAEDSYYDSDDFVGSRRNSFRPPSRPSSRPNSAAYQGGPLHRFISHEEHHGSGMGTPLEEIEEYEPLFPEDEESQEKPKAFKKRPGLTQHHFPSQDIWEDTPSSLQYQTTVGTPEPPAEKIAAAEGDSAKIFETPEQEEARRTGNQHDMTSDSKTFAKPHYKAGVLEELHSDSRPSHLQRFPSRDVWEDTPDSMRLVTTVSSPQMDETRSPPEDRPTTTAIPGSQDDAEARATTGFTQEVRPSIPARPERKSKLAQEIKPETEDSREKAVPDLGTNEQQVPDRTKPTIPDRPKPSVPARPARPSHSDQTAGAPLAKTASATSAGSGVSDDTVTSPPAPKAKPAVPARPAGGKIAALQSTFMNDLNNRLRVGPQAPKPKDPEVEEEAAKEPLADARKSRAKGPARRKPAASPSGAAAEPSISGFSFSTPTTLWHIDEHDELNVPASEPKSAVGGTDTPTTALEKELTANETRNTQDPPMTVKSGSMSEETAVPREAIGAEGDAPPPSISPAVVEEQNEVQPALETSLANAEPASANAEEQQAKETSEMAAGAGQKEMDVTSPEPAATRAQEEGDAIVQDGE